MNRITWTSLSIMIGLPVLLGFVAWLIAILSAAERWCGVQVTGDKLAARPIADCTSIVLQLIHWLGWFGISLIACACVAFLTIVARDLKAVLDVTGLGGTHLKIGGADPAGQAADKVAGAVVNAAEEVKSEVTS